MEFIIRSIKILFYYLLGALGIVFVSIVPSVISSGQIYNIPLYFKEFYRFVLVFIKPENWVYTYKNVPMPILDFLKEPYIYSAKIFISGILLGFAAALLLALLTLFLPYYVIDPIKRVLGVLETVPDLLIAVFLQVTVVAIFKKTGVMLVNFAVLGDETIYLAPILTLAILPAIYLFRLLLMLVEEEQIKPYTEYAMAKGMGRFRIVTIHNFRNIFPSIFHHSKILVWGGMSSLFIVEYIYNTRGLTYYIMLDFKPMVLSAALLMIYTPFFIFYQAGQEWLDHLEAERSTGSRSGMAAIMEWRIWKEPGRILTASVKHRAAILGAALFVFYCGYYLRTDEDPLKNILLSTSARAEASGDKTIALSNAKIKKQFNSMLKAIEDNNMKKFLSFQNKSNALFYREQESWLEEISQNKKAGWETSVQKGSINLKSADTGSLELKVNIKTSKGEEYAEKVTYSISKSGGKWLLNDLPFKEKRYNTVTVHYLKGMDKEADSLLLDATSVVRLYKQEFGWEPGPIHIKLYKTIEEMGATIPAYMVEDWSNYGESIKMITPVGRPGSPVLSILVSQLSSKMMQEMTNDNAPSYLQNGVADALRSAVTDSGDGGLLLNLDVLRFDEGDRLQMLKSHPLPIGQIGKLQTKNWMEQYASGFLLTSYLLREKGLEKFKEFAAELKKNDYIDKEIQNKLPETNELALKAMEKVYGPVDALSADYLDYYSSGRGKIIK
ncbi:ABC transporter permease subunit [Peribacillus kribbensis]|uniref:ABC transporter permease subunit n=1 Tax=Peribacillus kribbensis TaxID=356658 RepID=UPI00040CA83B|nr:ABC transporter permease subunit [Peribacillus kribbensis]